MNGEMEKAAEIIANITKPGISNEEVIHSYTTWAKTYEQVSLLLSKVVAVISVVILTHSRQQRAKIP